MEESEIKRIELLRDLYKDSFEVIEKRFKVRPRGYSNKRKGC